MTPGAVAVTATIADTEIRSLEERITNSLLERLHGGFISPWMNIDQAAEYLAWPKKRLYNLVSKQEIPCRKHGNRLLFNRTELDRWLDLHYQGPAELEPLHGEGRGPTIDATSNAPAALVTPRGRTQEGKSRVSD
jgi:excisionase family DNA binding protein